jgi:hypothetical protein
VKDLKKYEKDYKTQLQIKDIDHNIILENLRVKKFKPLEKVELNNSLYLLIEKYSLALGCKLATSIFIYEHEKLIKVNIVTAGGKLSEFLDFGSYTNTHNDVINIVEEVLNF